MLKELSKLKPFFEDPYKTYSARDIAKQTHTNHVTIAKKLKEYPFIKRAPYGPYNGFKANITEEFINLRKLYNLQKIQESNTVKELITFYDQPTIILFGSYATATNTNNSDVDIAIISEKQETFPETKHKDIKNIQIFLYTKDDIQKLKKDHPELLNNLCNGIVLHGEFEVFI